jgi:uncharacterized membrane protein YkvA (DUF1232 family)
MNQPQPAVSLDEYIEHLKSGFHAADLLSLRNLVPQLREKAAAAGTAGHPDVMEGARILERTLLSAEAAAASDPLPKHLAEAGVAAAYLLKGIDIIPDMVPEIGYSDDAWIVARVLQRNPELTALS